MASSRILVVTTEPLPLPGCQTSGAGLRTWGLARGLESRGHTVTIATLETLDNRPAPETLNAHRVLLFKRTGLSQLVREFQPDALVMQHWGLMDKLEQVETPLAIDLAGPHLLERIYWDTPDPARDRREKLAALHRADFVCCSGWRQRLYFLPLLSEAGWAIADPAACPVIPFSLDPQLPDEKSRELDRIVYGGFFLPWQDPTMALEVCLEAMDEVGRGTLDFFGGAHPSLDVSLGKFATLEQRLAEHPRVTVHEPLPYQELIERYFGSGWALDLLARNPERELAFTTRTVVYLWCGLPVIYNDYSDLSDLIARYQAGRTLDPVDRESVKEAIRTYLTQPEQVRGESSNARRLVREQLDWTRTIEPLAQWCAAPEKRARAARSVGAGEPEWLRVERLERELAATGAEFETLRGKWIYRVHQKLGALGPLLALFVYLLVLPFALLLALVLPRRPKEQAPEAADDEAANP